MRSLQGVINIIMRSILTTVGKGPFNPFLIFNGLVPESTMLVKVLGSNPPLMAMLVSNLID